MTSVTHSLREKEKKKIWKHPLIINGRNNYGKKPDKRKKIWNKKNRKRNSIENEKQTMKRGISEQGDTETNTKQQ